MKKYVFALMLVFAVALLSSCEVVKGLNNADTQFSTVDIMIESNPSTGYSWVALSTDESVAVVLDDQLLVSSQPDGLVGSSGVQVFTVYGVKPGSAMLVFDYQRPWEGVPVDQRMYQVDVMPDGRIIVSEL